MIIDRSGVHYFGIDLPWWFVAAWCVVMFVLLAVAGVLAIRDRRSRR